MSVITLGVSGALNREAAAALYIDNQLIAAAEEERFLRKKDPACNLPYHAVRYCLQQANLCYRDVETIAIPYDKISLLSPARWHYARRYWYAPDRALETLCNGNKHFHRLVKSFSQCFDQLGFRKDKIRVEHVPFHFAQASSAYHLSGFKDKTAILSIDDHGEYTAVFLAYGEQGKIHKIKEFYRPDSIGSVYGAMTEYLGFRLPNGVSKVMNMAPYGDADKYDLSPLIDFDGRSFKANTNLVSAMGLRRYKSRGKGFRFTPKLVDWLGAVRKCDIADEPYVHYAAAVQALYETVVLQLIDTYLSSHLKESGKLVLAGSGTFNDKLNAKISHLPYVKSLFIQPAAGDYSAALGAASFLMQKQGITVDPLQHVYLGPQFSIQQCIDACQTHAFKPQWRRLENPAATAAQLIAEGEVVGWFQGRVEFGQRSLGNRSILADPGKLASKEKINQQIKYRESWRPYAPSILDRVAAEILQTDRWAPFMSMSYQVTEAWQERLPAVLCADGFTRAHIVRRDCNEKFYTLLEEVEKLTGVGVVLNTSLNRRREALVSSPTDALNMFIGSDLRYLVLEDLLIYK